MNSFVIGGTHSGVGKTTVTLGLMSAFARRGLRIQGFKVGPDFIDPAFHKHACQGIPSRNLDGWMMPKEVNLKNFNRFAALADLSIVEGVMGLFDGAGGRTESGSTSQMAKWLELPLILVVDASAMSRSAAAMVKGFVEFDSELNVAGVIFNRVAGATHYKWLKEAVAENLSVPVLGGIPRHAEIQIPERHLGLHMPEESATLNQNYWDRLADIMEDHLDLEELLKIAKVYDIPESKLQMKVKSPEIKIAVARDEAFCFYYEDNLDYLRSQGVKLVEFSPLRGRLPLDVQGVYLGGGYPELYAEALSKNEVIRDQIRHFVNDGGMVYAECGGLIYLSQGLQLKDGRKIPLCGAFPFWTRMTSRCKLGYAQVNVRDQGLSTPVSIRGHYFHYSEIIGSYKGTYEYEVSTTDGKKFLEGFKHNNAIASYVHLHFGSNPRFIEVLLKRCAAKTLLRHVGA